MNQKHLKDHYHLIVIYNTNPVTTLKKNYDQLLALTESNKNTIRELEKANEKSQKCIKILIQTQ